MNDHTLGDAPIEAKYRETMNVLAHLARAARANYISNCQREDVVVLLRKRLRRFEGAPDVEGHA